MNEADLKDEGAEAVEWVDCGQVTEVTRGVPLVLLFELGPPPFNRMYLA